MTAMVNAGALLRWELFCSLFQYLQDLQSPIFCSLPYYSISSRKPDRRMHQVAQFFWRC